MKRTESIDIQWFEKRMDEVSVNRTKIASLARVEKSKVTRLLQGTNAWSGGHIAAFAAALHTTPTEILEHIGVDTHRLRAEAALDAPQVCEPAAEYRAVDIPLIGTVDDSGVVTQLPTGKHVVPRPDDRAVGALQVRTLDRYDGCFFCFGAAAPTREHVGRPCVVETPTGMRVAILARGLGDRFDLVSFFDNRKRIEGADITSVFPIVCVKF